MGGVAYSGLKENLNVRSSLGQEVQLVLLTFQHFQALRVKGQGSLQMMRQHTCFRTSSRDASKSFA